MGYLRIQQVVLYERCLSRQYQDLIAELQKAADMVCRAGTDQQKRDSVLYADQIFDEIAEIEENLYQVRAELANLIATTTGRSPHL